MRLFNISAGIGFDAAVCQEADSSYLKSLLNKLRMGKLIYITEAIHMILASPMVGMKITCDGFTYLKPRTLFRRCHEYLLRGRRIQILSRRCEYRRRTGSVRRQ